MNKDKTFKHNEEKLNLLWKYLQKVEDKNTLSRLSLRGFLYGVGRLSQLRVMIELISTYFGYDITKSRKVKKLLKIMEEDK